MVRPSGNPTFSDLWFWFDPLREGRRGGLRAQLPCATRRGKATWATRVGAPAGTDVKQTGGWVEGGSGQATTNREILGRREYGPAGEISRRRALARCTRRRGSVKAIALSTSRKFRRPTAAIEQVASSLMRTKCADSFRPPSHLL